MRKEIALTPFLFLFLLSINANTQDRETEAQFYYTKAESFYNEGKFNDAQTELNKCITIIGKTNSKIQYLLIKTLDKSFNVFPSVYVIADLKKCINTFFEITNSDTYPKEKYFEILDFKSFYFDESKIKKYFYDFYLDQHNNLFKATSPEDLVFTKYFNCIDTINQCRGYPDIQDSIKLLSSDAIIYNLGKEGYGWAKGFPYDYSGYAYVTYHWCLKYLLKVNNYTMYKNIGTLIYTAADYFKNGPFGNSVKTQNFNDNAKGYLKFLPEIPYIIENLNFEPGGICDIWAGLRNFIESWDKYKSKKNNSNNFFTNNGVDARELIVEIKKAIEKRGIQDTRIESNGKFWTLKSLNDYSKIDE